MTRTSFLDTDCVDSKGAKLFDQDFVSKFDMDGKRIFGKIYWAGGHGGFAIEWFNPTVYEFTLNNSRSLSKVKIPYRNFQYNDIERLWTSNT